tara:strand:+ start:319 stop:855 length:537 start_codon:yes stop_codon:yes gene_type:complete
MYELLILDVDGVLTTGKKYYDLNGNTIMKTFNDRDFTAIKQFMCSGLNVIFLSGDQQVNQQVAEKRCIPFFYSRRDSGKLSKAECAEEIFKIFNVEKKNVIFVGDDLFDIEMRNFADFMACPSNSHYLMKKSSDLILNSNSGEGCIQELFEYFVNKKLINEPSIEKVIGRDSSEQVKY